MMDENFDQLIGEADSLTWGNPAKLTLGEQAVRLADRYQDEGAQFYARARLIEYAVSVGAIDRALVACAWCASRPELLEQSDWYTKRVFLWNLKHILHGTYQLPTIEMGKIFEILEQMSNFHRDYGYNQRATEYLRFVNLMNVGHWEAAAEAYSKFIEIPRDSMADCDACEANTQIEYLSIRRRDEEALALSGPLVSGERSCVEVPHATYCRLLQPLLRQGETDRADEYNKTGYAKIRTNPFLLKEAAIHIGFDIHRSKYARAVSRFERQLPVALKSVELVEKYYFFTVAEHLMEQLAARRNQRKFQLPPEFPCYQRDDQYRCDVVRQWFQQQNETLAEAFDRRNGNDYFSQQLRESLRFENV